MKTYSHAVISGGGSGLGHGLALRLLRRGSNVSILDLSLSEQRSSELQKAAEQGACQWQFYPADITDSQQLQKQVDAAAAHAGPIALAINSAGIAVNKSFADTSSDDFQRVININLVGSFNFAQATLPHMQPGSRLTLIASIAGLLSNYGYTAYGSSKFGVVGLATTLRFEYEPLGIKISCVCPPEVKTPMVAEELLTGNPVSLELKQVAGSLEADVACDQILAGIDRGQWQIIPGIRAKATCTAARYFPKIFYAITHRLICYVMRKHGIATY
ncbi:MAG: SDR family NAD(P)-dependent oxidoreductase [Spongiibacteraceae bacterium]